MGNRFEAFCELFVIHFIKMNYIACEKQATMGFYSDNVYTQASMKWGFC